MGNHTPENAGEDGDRLDDYGKSMLLHFEDLYSSNVSLYVEEELTVHFGDMIPFVKKVEQSLALGGETKADDSEKELARKIMTHFKSVWQDSIQDLNKQVHSDFS